MTDSQWQDALYRLLICSSNLRPRPYLEVFRVLHDRPTTHTVLGPPCTFGRVGWVMVPSSSSSGFHPPPAREIFGSGHQGRVFPTNPVSADPRRLERTVLRFPQSSREVLAHVAPTDQVHGGRTQKTHPPRPRPKGELGQGHLCVPRPRTTRRREGTRLLPRSAKTHRPLSYGRTTLK